MRARGISYDTGFVRGGTFSRETFDIETFEAELRVIHDDLHCNAVRLIGGDARRLELAARCAADLGMEVWFSPYPLELSAAEMVSLFADCAERAERLRQRGADVVFVVGAELSLMNHGFLPGANLEERLNTLMSRPQDVRERTAEASARVNAFLSDAVTVVRKHFAGKVTYAAVPFERVDWRLFDFVSVDLYRTPAVAERFAGDIRALVAQGKPVAITEFGAAGFRGASKLGAQALEIVEVEEKTGAPLRLDGVYERDEEEQATCIRELLEIFEDAGVDSAFLFTFALYSYPYRADGDPRDDLDLASYGIVKVLEEGRGVTYPDMAWEPKAAFRAVAEYYEAPA